MEGAAACKRCYATKRKQWAHADILCVRANSSWPCPAARACRERAGSHAANQHGASCKPPLSQSVILPLPLPSRILATAAVPDPSTACSTDVRWCSSQAMAHNPWRACHAVHRLPLAGNARVACTRGPPGVSGVRLGIIHTTLLTGGATHGHTATRRF